MSAITAVHGRQILDSRGNPTVEVDVFLADGSRGTAAVPSGASTGQWEAVELRDGGAAWGGKGVGQAVANVSGEIQSRLIGMDATDQRTIDAALIRQGRVQIGTAELRAPREGAWIPGEIVPGERGEADVTSLSPGRAGRPRTSKGGVKR